MHRILLICSLISCSFLSAQDTLIPVIFLDGVEISVKNNGFTVDDFVGYVKKDTTFYMGFKHLRYYSHNYESNWNA
jgi:hypothetical protein